MLVRKYATKYPPVTVEQMRRMIAEQIQQGGSSEEVMCRVALVLGPNFPTEVVDLYCRFAFKKGVTISRIACTDPMVEAIEGGGYEGAPMGVLQAGGRPQKVYLLKPEYAKEFDLIEAVNFFDYEGGMVCAICCDASAVARVLDWGP